jgi:hypothetical protein
VLFGVIVVVGLIAIGAVLHLTNNSASAKLPPLSPASAQALFVRAGNGVCARFYNELMVAFEGRSIAKSRKANAAFLRTALPLADRRYAGLRALVPPDREARTYRRLLRLVRRGDRDAHVALHAYATGQPRRATLVERDERRIHLDRRANSLSRKLGLTICGLNGHQVARRYG